jgi:REP-associated tyrosine transposase
MSRPLRIQYPGAVYHVTCRGNERKEIFREDGDRPAFLAILIESQEIYQVILYAWVLMENHFHLLLETPLGNLDQFMRRFNITYTSYFNRKYQRVGHLYQGRYKSILVEKESYLSGLSRYIHLNPIRIERMKSWTPAEKIKFLSSYPWSTLAGYLNEKKKVDGVDYSLILGEFGGDHSGGRKAYRKRIGEDILGELEVFPKIVGGSILGKEDFVGWVKKNFLVKGPDREYIGARKIKGYKVRETIMEVLSKETGRTEAELLTEKGDRRRIAMELLYRLGGLNGVEIGEIFKVSYNAVSQERKRLVEKMKSDPKVKRYFVNSLRKLGNYHVII